MTTIDIVFDNRHLLRMDVNRVPNIGEHIIIKPAGEKYTHEYQITKLTTDYVDNYVILHVR